MWVLLSATDSWFIKLSILDYLQILQHMISFNDWWLMIASSRVQRILLIKFKMDFFLMLLDRLSRSQTDCHSIRSHQNSKTHLHSQKDLYQNNPTGIKGNLADLTLKLNKLCHVSNTRATCPLHVSRAHNTCEKYMCHVLITPVIHVPRDKYTCHVTNTRAMCP